MYSWKKFKRFETSCIKGVVPKRHPQLGGNLSSVDILPTRGVLQMHTTALFGTKIFRFFEIYGVSTLTREVEPVRTFCGQAGMGVNFLRFYVDVLYGWSLRHRIATKC